MNIILLTTSFSIMGLLEFFLIAILILAIIAGLIWAIERWISPIPGEIKLIIAIVLILIVVLVALKQFAVV